MKIAVPSQMLRAMAGQALSSPTKKHIAALDGIRFIAALFVAAAHYSAWILAPGPLTDLIMSLSGLGMTLFFVLSGFVIHYNYGTLLRQPGGLKEFAIARFSRLYPLYILVFLTEFILLLWHRSGSCALVGHPAGLALALPYYLTLTQDWVYGVVCKNSLIYQYGMMASVSWSISAEVFFYVVYCFYGQWAATMRATTLFAVAGVGYLVPFAFVYECFVHGNLIEQSALAAFGPIATEQNGYQDSLLRWLYYFNPISQIAHFFAGVAVAQSFLTAKVVNPHGKWLVLAATLLLFGTHFYLYGIIAPHNGFVGRNASLFYGPLVVLSIYLIVMFPEAVLSRLCARPFMVSSGEASYSLYLLHAFFAPFLLRLQALNLYHWVLWGTCLILLLCVSRLSYVCFERPARNILRGYGSRRPSAPRRS